MRTPALTSVGYSPNQIPTNPADFARFLREELDRISSAINALALGHLDKTFVEPAKPRDGDLRYADGISWDPGSGKGIYMYSTVWTLVKALP